MWLPLAAPKAVVWTMDGGGMLKTYSGALGVTNRAEQEATAQAGRQPQLDA